MKPEKQMDFEVVNDTELNCMVVRTSGFGSLENIYITHKALLSHPMWAPGRNVIVDHRELELSHLQPSDVGALVGMVKDSREELGDGRFAVILGSDFVFGLGRMWEITSESETDMKIHIFRDAEEALLWVSHTED